MIHFQCPKCKCFSGDDWSQCTGGCPVDQSPYFEQSEHDKYGDLILFSQEAYNRYRDEAVICMPTYPNEVPF